MQSVAPFAGAWIEILITASVTASVVVAPFAGAWIEIDLVTTLYDEHLVAPFAGAWIEIDRNCRMEEKSGGRSLRGSVD